MQKWQGGIGTSRLRTKIRHRMGGGGIGIASKFAEVAGWVWDSVRRTFPEYLFL